MKVMKVMKVMILDDFAKFRRPNTTRRMAVEYQIK